MAVSSTAFMRPALAAGDTQHHGLSAFGDLGYPADFKHVKYVNPAAPKGGTFSQLAGGGTATFNSFNGFILKGDAAADMEQAFAALMWRATDEPDAVYAYAADMVTVSDDGLVYKFHLRDGITFHDGSPITAEDVAFSLDTLKTKGHPAIGNLLRSMTSAETEGDRVWDHKGVSLLSTPDLCAADKDQLRLALDPLIGIEVHLVLTVGSWAEQLYGEWLAELASGRDLSGGTDWDTYASRVSDAADDLPRHRQAEEFWAGHDLPAVLARWGWTFHAERLHVVVDPDPAGQWASFLDLAGVPEADDLPAVVPRPWRQRRSTARGPCGRSSRSGRTPSPPPGTTCAATCAPSARTSPARPMPRSPGGVLARRGPRREPALCAPGSRGSGSRTSGSTASAASTSAGCASCRPLEG